MTQFQKDLDDYFCKKYSDGVKIAAIPGYEPPRLLLVEEREQGVYAPDAERLKLCYQAEPEVLLERFLANRADLSFSFSVSIVPFFEKIKDKFFRKHTFAKLLPAVLAAHPTEGISERLGVEESVWQGILQGKYYPARNLVLSLSLVLGLTYATARDLMAVCGYVFADDRVEDIVVSYLLSYQITNAELQRAALERYGITEVRIGNQNK